MTAPQLKLVHTDIDREIEETSLEIAGDVRLMRQKSGVVPPGPRWYTDISNAEYFLGDFGRDLRFCVESDTWMVYSGKFWQVDREFFVMEYAREFVKAELEAALQDATDKTRLQNALRINDERGLNPMMKQAKQQAAVSISMFDAKSTDYLLNCNNGTLDLKTGKLRPHDREDFITRVISADYDEAADCPRFDKFLTEIQPDAEIRGFLQRSIGYSLLGSVPEHAFWILYGIGNNGKSVFTKLFIDLLGPYASGMQAESLMDSKRQAGSASEDIARLKAKRFVLVSESNDGERINAAQIKAFSAGDVVTARELFKGSFDFAFTGKLWIATNHKPTITDHSKGLWRRVKLVPFAQNIADDKVIKQDELHAMFRSEFSGILNWAVRGCLEYIKHDSLQTPPVIQKEIDAYKLEQDSIAQFLLECCQTIEQYRQISAASGAYAADSEFQVKNPDLFDAYLAYCKRNGERYPFKQTRFSRNLIERGFKQRNSGGRYWEGLRLIES